MRVIIATELMAVIISSYFQLVLVTGILVVFTMSVGSAVVQQVDAILQVVLDAEQTMK